MSRFPELDTKIALEQAKAILGAAAIYREYKRIIATKTNDVAHSQGIQILPFNPKKPETVGLNTTPGNNLGLLIAGFWFTPNEQINLFLGHADHPSVLSRIRNQLLPHCNAREICLDVFYEERRGLKRAESVRTRIIQYLRCADIKAERHLGNFRRVLRMPGEGQKTETVSLLMEKRMPMQKDIFPYRPALIILQQPSRRHS